MLDLIRKSLLAGLGAGVITREKAEESVNRLVEQGKLSREEANEFVDKLLNSGNKQWDEIQDGLMKSIHEALDNADVARGKDLKDLAHRVENIEQRLTMLENRLPESGSA